jgi:RNA polymerase sigma-70 factor (ECF subfamily)
VTSRDDDARGVLDRAEPDASDPAALFKRYAPYVARTAFRLLGRDDEVDDVVQDVFLAGLTGLAELRDPQAIRGWLATVTVRVARRKLWLRRVRSFLRLDETPDYAAVARDASAEDRVLLASIYAELDRLPVDERVAWTLRFVEGEDLEGVAKLSGCSLATAKRRISAAQQAIERVVR